MMINNNHQSNDELPLRLSVSGDSRMKQLLRAARKERPRHESKVEAAAVALLLLTSTSTGFFFSLKKAWVLIGATVLGLGVVAAVITTASITAPVLAGDPPHAHTPERAALVVRPSVPESFALSDSSEPDDDLLEPARTPPSLILAPGPSTAPTASPTKREEISELALLRRARLELGRSTQSFASSDPQFDPRAALAVLDEHARIFPTGALREEAAALRVEALAKSGNAPSARAAAAHFANTYPQSPYGERVRSATR